MTKLPLHYVNEYRDVRGKIWRYFRRRGHRRIPLPGLPGSDEFMAAYQAALAGVATSPGASRTKPGTLNATIVGYYQSPAFHQLAAGTQAGRRNVLERFREQHGDNRIAMLEQRHIIRHLSRMKPAASRNLLKALRALLDFAVTEGYRPDNPAAGIKFRKYKPKSHHAWTAEEIAQFEAHWPVGTKPRLALALLLHTAQRRGDVVLMGPRHIRGASIYVKQQKTGAELQIPITAELRAVLEKTPVQAFAFLTTEHGTPYKPGEFSEWFRRQCDAAGLPKHCVPHGLRHAAATRLAEAGASPHQIAAITGHKSLTEVARYTKTADQARMAIEASALGSTGRRTDCEQEVTNIPIC
jgi:integrase